MFSKAVEAEERVAKHWCAHGWRLLTKNYRGVGFEIDLILQKGSTISFVEVKARKYLGAWQLTDFISSKKRESLQRGAHHYLHYKRPKASNFRYDLCLVVGSKITTIPNVIT